MVRGADTNQVVERCPSGIPGFDALCSGGFVRNSTNAVLGGPGAGKTLFLMQFLHNGFIEHEEPGLYLSFEPDVMELFKDAAAMGWDMEKLDSKDQCKFYRISPNTSVEELKKDLTKLISKYGIKRICFDPIGLFQAGESNDAKLRILIFDLMSLLKRLNVTILIADEIPDVEGQGMALGNQKSEYTKFLADGLVEIYSSGLGGVSDRAVRISKMRRTKHVRGPVPMQITNKGVTILSKGNL